MKGSGKSLFKLFKIKFLLNEAGVICLGQSYTKSFSSNFFQHEKIETASQVIFYETSLKGENFSGLQEHYETNSCMIAVQSVYRHAVSRTEVVCLPASCHWLCSRQAEWVSDPTLIMTEYVCAQRWPAKSLGHGITHYHSNVNMWAAYPLIVTVESSPVRKFVQWHFQNGLKLYNGCVYTKVHT